MNSEIKRGVVCKYQARPFGLEQGNRSGKRMIYEEWDKIKLMFIFGSLLVLLCDIKSSN